MSSQQRVRRAAAVVLSTLVVAAACTEEVVGLPEAASIALNLQDPVVLYGIGETVQLEAEPLDADGNPIDAEVFWSSSDGTVISVDEAGLASALSHGVANLTATSGEVSASVQISAIDTDQAIFLLAPESVAPGDTAAVEIHVGTATLAGEVRGAVGVTLEWDEADLTPVAFRTARAEDLYAYDWFADGAMSLVVSTPQNTAAEDLAITVLFTADGGASGRTEVELEGLDLIGAGTFESLIGQVYVAGTTLTIE